MSPTLNIFEGELSGNVAFRRHLADLVLESSAGAVAKRFGIKGSYLAGLISGRSSIGPEAAKRFGFELLRYTVFVPLPPNSKPESGETSCPS